MADDTKQCPRCGETKGLAEFYVRRDRNSHMSHCKDCGRLLEAQWRNNNRAKYRAKMRRADLLRNHGLTPEDWDAMLVAQGGRCAICGTTEPGGIGRFHIDHDHSCCQGTRGCGRCIRGLLCNRCNTGVGQFQDDPARLRSAAEYLELRREVR